MEDSAFLKVLARLYERTGKAIVDPTHFPHEIQRIRDYIYIECFLALIIFYEQFLLNF